MGGIEQEEEKAPASSQEVPTVTPEEARAALSSADTGMLDNVRTLVNSKVSESTLPTKEGLGYESKVGIYGGKLARDSENRLVFDTRGTWSQIDKWGDRILRTFDEHHVRKPLAMLRRHPKAFLQFLPFIADAKRYRTTPEQTLEKVHRLGLDDMYGPHPWGIEIKQPEVYSHCTALLDIFHQDQINDPSLSAIDRFDALGKAAGYMMELHKTGVGLGEAGVTEFLFKETREGKVENPTLLINGLTITYNPEKHISDIEKKATDLLDLFTSAAMQEFRRSKNWESVDRALDTVAGNYQDPEVISMVASYVKRGRLTLPGDLASPEFQDTESLHKSSRAVFALHNEQRLGADKTVTSEVRKRIIEACERRKSTEKGV